MAEKSRQSQDHRAAVHRVREAQGFTMNLPGVGQVKVPHPEQLAFYGALGILAAVQVIDWPVALVLGVGHMLLHNEHNRIAQEVGEALAEA